MAGPSRLAFAVLRAGLVAHDRGCPAEGLSACRAGHFHFPADAALLRLEEQLARGS